LDELDAAEFEQVLTHEMSHLRRWDDWTQLLQTAIEAVLFFNPAIYFIGRRLKIEREMACDDWVVSSTGEPRPYAACLTHLHELTRRAAAPQLAPGVTTRRRWQISARVEALLAANRSRTPYFARSGWIAAGALAASAFVLAAKTVPPVAVAELPLAQLALANPAAPGAPAISVTPRKAVSERPRLWARALKIGPQAPQTDQAAMLVRAVQFQLTPTYYIVAVIFIEPPPDPAALNGI
jgi:hypothetical protein